MIVIGCGGHILDLVAAKLLDLSDESIFFFDDISENIPLYIPQHRRVRSIDEYEDLSNDKTFVLAIGSPAFRAKSFEFWSSRSYKPLSIISENSITTNIDNSLGINVMPGVFIGAETNIGQGVLLNSHSSAHHECTIGEYSVISPGARVLGKAKVGNKSEIGANATVLPGIVVGDNCRVGAGAVVTKNVADGEVVVGVPAKPVIR